MAMNEAKAPARRVAVIAIHGVADQQPSDTASRIANLLLTHEPESYTGFVQTDVRVGVHRVHMKPPSPAEAEEESETGAKPKNAGRDPRGPAKELFQVNPRSQCVQKARKQAVKQFAQSSIQAEVVAVASDPLTDIDHKYMREQLETYTPQGSDSVYESVRLAGNRLPNSSAAKDPNAPPCEVHIYENYWADISRAASTWRRLIMEFYLLLFYLCGLGRHSIEFAQVAYSAPKQVFWWRWFGRFQLLAEGLLVLGLPILNLCLLGLTTVTLPMRLEYHNTLLALGIGALVAVTTGFVLYLYRYKCFPEQRVPWVTSILLLGLITFGVSWLLLTVLRPLSPIVPLAVMCWGVSAVIILWLMAAYQRTKKGAFPLSLCAVGLVTAAFLFNPHLRKDADVFAISDATLLTAEVTFALLCILWVLYSLSYIAVWITGFFAVRAVDKRDRPAARRVRWTVHLTLVLPGVLLAVANVVLWQALLLVLKPFIIEGVYDPTVFDRWLFSSTIATFSQNLLQLTAGPYLTSAYLLPLLAGVVLVWALLPVLLTEVKVPAREESSTRWLGACLDRTVRVALWVGIALAAVITLTPVMYALTWWDPHYERWPELIRYRPGRILAAAGSLVLLIVLGSKLPFKTGGKTLRSVIDVALDVANWMRVHPKTGNPKARISARFVSLLRHVNKWKDPDDGSGYKAVVIIAHSQGTVIAAEVLRFLQKEPDPTLQEPGRELPIYLFTMGSPLRQLYSLRFPHHYQWASWPQPGGEQLPDPAALGVHQWVNAYRSADYVGRYLWCSDSDPERWSFLPRNGPGRREQCIGGGGHNHYWDETAPDIARELDRLIVEAAGLSAHGTAPERQAA